MITIYQKNISCTISIRCPLLVQSPRQAEISNMVFRKYNVVDKIYVMLCKGLGGPVFTVKH